MPAALIESESKHVIQLEGEIDIAGAAELKSMLMTAVASGKSVEIDLERVTDLDITAVQLLCAAAYTAGKTGRSLIAVGVAERHQNAVRDMGLHAFPGYTNPAAKPVPSKDADSESAQ